MLSRSNIFRERPKGPWRRERDSNPRETFRPLTVFKTVAFNHSAIPPPEGLAVVMPLRLDGLKTLSKISGRTRNCPPDRPPRRTPEILLPRDRSAILRRKPLLAQLAAAPACPQIVEAQAVSLRTGCLPIDDPRVAGPLPDGRRGPFDFGLFGPCRGAYGLFRLRRLPCSLKLLCPWRILCSPALCRLLPRP